MTSARENADDDNTTLVAAKSGRLQNIVEAYIALLDRQRDGGDVVAETFALAEAIRGRSVQQALAASSARMLAKDPALADVVRQEQDLVKQVNAQLGTLNNVLSLASHERDEKGVLALRASINSLRAERDRLREQPAGCSVARCELRVSSVALHVLSSDRHQRESGESLVSAGTDQASRNARSDDRLQTEIHAGPLLA